MKSSLNKREQMQEVRRSNLTKLVGSFGSIASFARRVNKSPSQIGDMLQGRKSFGHKIAAQIETALNLQEGALSTQSESFEYIPLSDLSDRRIPVVSYVQAGSLNMCDEMHDETVTVPSSAPKNAFAMRIKGESMKPRLQEGDLILIDPDRSPTPGDIVVARSDENFTEEATVKQYAITGMDDEGNEIFELRPINPLFGTYSSDEHRLSIVGVVFEIRQFI